jgi:proliferating cell nuclear antigen
MLIYVQPLPCSSVRFVCQAKKGDSDESEIAVSIVLQQSVTLTFSLKYLLNFAKSAPLSKSVSLNLSNDVPLLVSFALFPLPLPLFLRLLFLV